MIITVCTELSLLQLIKRFKLYVVKQHELTLFSFGNIDLHTRLSVNVRIKHVFSMNFTHFHEIILQQEFFHCTLHQMFLHCNRPNGSKYANTKKASLDRVLMAKQCL